MGPQGGGRGPGDPQEATGAPSPGCCCSPSAPGSLTPAWNATTPVSRGPSRPHLLTRPRPLQTTARPPAVLAPGAHPRPHSSLPPAGRAQPAGACKRKTGSGRAHGDCAAWPSTCTCVLRTGAPETTEPLPWGPRVAKPSQSPSRLPAAFSSQRGPRVGARAFDGQQRPRVQHQGTGLRRPDRGPRPASPNRTPRP